MLGTVDDIEGIDADERSKLNFAVRSFVDAMSPSNFALTNPEVLKRTIETKGENLLKGLANMLNDIAAGQMTQSKPGAFEVGRNLATTPGKVIHETPLYQLIQYTPTTDEVLETPLVIFPPWINRFYILDLTPEKSFVKWCVDQGVTLFMVSWKSADESIADASLDDYVLKGQVDAIDTIRGLLDVEAVHAIGYCVAGTTLAATLAYLHAKGQQAKVKSATFFTAQVDFSEAGDLKLFLGDETMGLLQQLTTEKGLSRRPLHGRDLQPAARARPHLELCRQQLSARAGAGAVRPAALEQRHDQPARQLAPRLSRHALQREQAGRARRDQRCRHSDRPRVRLTTPTYIQAGREDHIAPPQSVWKVMDHFQGDKRFVLAGSGHIAGVVNPPAAGKYQYWVNDKPAGTLQSFVDGATEHKGSWWPDWIEWLKGQAPRRSRPTARAFPARASSRRSRTRPAAT